MSGIQMVVWYSDHHLITSLVFKWWSEYHSKFSPVFKWHSNGFILDAIQNPDSRMIKSKNLSFKIGAICQPDTFEIRTF